MRPGRKPWKISAPSYAPVRRQRCWTPLALHLQRRVNADHQLDFPGQSWHLAPTKRAAITLIHHPLRQFWASTQPPAPPLNNGPESLGKYSL